MALFLRREIQRRIEAAAAFVAENKIDGLVRRLNLPNKQSIEAQWELAWLTALSRVGEVGYESKFAAGTSFPDIHFRQGSFSFIVDVTAASDVGYDDENPIDAFNDAIDVLYRRFRARGGFSVKIDSELVGTYGDQRVKLFIPGKSQAHAFIKQHFSDFVRDAVANSDASAHCSATFEGRTISMAYNPAQRPYNRGGGHLSVNVPYSAKRNPVFNALKAKKEQLKRSGFTGLKGVVLCDGSCRMLTADSGSSAFSLRDILSGFCRGTRAIDFILTVGVHEQYQSWGRRSTYSLKSYLHLRDGMPAEDANRIKRVFNLAVKYLPAPQRAGYQAHYMLDRGSPPPAWYTGISGSFEMAAAYESMKIKISSRRLLALIAGDMTAEEFRSAYSLPQNGNNARLDVLGRAIKEGRMVADAHLEPNFDEDDDHLVLELGAVDAAAAKFQHPNRQPS